jgi:hypothetical protein
MRNLCRTTLPKFPSFKGGLEVLGLPGSIKGPLGKSPFCIEGDRRDFSLPGVRLKGLINVWEKNIHLFLAVSGWVQTLTTPGNSD